MLNDLLDKLYIATNHNDAAYILSDVDSALKDLSKELEKQRRELMREWQKGNLRTTGAMREKIKQLFGPLIK